MSSSILAPPKRLRSVVSALTSLAETVATPLVPADYLDLVAPLRSGAALRGRVVAVTPETADAVTVTIRPGRAWRRYRAGQYVRIGVDVDGVRQWRAYSLTSGPGRADGLIAITVKAIPDGRVSGHVVRKLRPGAILHLDQPAGDFVLPSPLPERVLFVTAGSGVTPVMGMLRHHLDALPDVVLVHSAPTTEDVVFGAELRSLAAAGRIRLVERHTASSGVLRPVALDELVPDWRDRQTWGCGPTGLLDALERHWSDADLADRLHTERFRPVVITTGEGGSLSFARQDRVVASDGTAPILQTGEDAGVAMPSGCRMGICFGCVVGLTEGAVRDLRNGELTTATRGDGVRIQTCVTAAAGACTLDL
ncbi:ferredoxin reductase [uncultured Friedmanniella sp.]|uniref:ferredoxin reductase n=1 Tax=uncultured Friedmanniella sp. TaxID=335381 RepID=UPI0035C9E0CE